MSKLVRLLLNTLAAALLAVAGVAFAQAQKDQLTLSRDSAVELLSQLDQLQSEVRDLRNQIELQRNELDQMKAAQRDQMRDLDQRLLTLERNAATNASVQQSTSAAQPPASATAQSAAPGSSVTAAVAPVPTRGSPSAAEQRDYDAAFNLLKQGLYSQASDAFRAFVQKYPRSSLAGNAEYWNAEANYVVRNFGVALEQFNKVVSDYPNSPKVPDALLKIGYSYYELNNWDKARDTLNNVITRFPNTTVAKLAEIRLAKMKDEGH